MGNGSGSRHAIVTAAYPGDETSYMLRGVAGQLH